MTNAANLSREFPSDSGALARRPRRLLGVRTNNLGEYSAAVDAGEYFVAVELKSATMAVAAELGQCEMMLPGEDEPPRVRAIAEPDGRFALALNYASRSSPIAPSNSTYVTTFYPNAIDRDDAVRLTVRSGERRRGIDVQLPLVPARRISGRLVGPDGHGVNNGSLTLRRVGREMSLGGPVAPVSETGGSNTLRSLPETPDGEVGWAGTDADGTFVFLNIPAGAYTLQAIRSFGRCDVGEVDYEDWRASVPISIGAANISNLAITMQAHAQVTRPLVGEFHAGPGAADQAVRTGASAAALSGVVVDDLRHPVSRAIVELIGDGLGLGRLTLTDDAGRFTVPGLPAGSFAVLAAKAGYSTAVVGRKLSGATGVPVPLNPGERRSVTIELPRATVVTGIVRNARGEPVEGAHVNLERWVWEQGRRVLTDGSSYIPQPIGTAGTGCTACRPVSTSRSQTRSPCRRERCA